MCCLHISSFIIVGPANNHSNKLFLPASLLHHVGILEEIVNHWISEHIIVKFIDYSTNSTFSSQPLKEGSIVFLFGTKSTYESLEYSDFWAKKDFFWKLFHFLFIGLVWWTGFEWALFFDCFNITFNRVEYFSKFGYLSCWNIKEMKRLFKVNPSFIKLFFADFESGMGGFHIGSFILVRSTCNKSDKLFLPLSLLFHISVWKEGTNDWIS